jgi:hypothetical protein
VSSVEQRRRVAPRSRHRPVLRVVLAALAAILAFLLGIAFARTLDDRPTNGGEQTIVRTLTPRPQDAPGRTVTVTVTAQTP